MKRPSNRTTIGFTGTQTGMTLEQGKKVSDLIHSVQPRECHHGDCIGADTDFHRIVETISKAKIIIHPPNNYSKRAFNSGLLLCEKPYLTRNKDIVNSCDMMFACPDGKEVIRSGTWSTIRYAKKIGKPIVIVYPNGKVEEFGLEY